MLTFSVIVRDGKGGKDRVVMLPHALESALKSQLATSHALWSADRAAQRPGVIFHMRLKPSTHVQGKLGLGIGCLRRPICRWTLAAALSVGITCMNKGFNVP